MPRPEVADAQQTLLPGLDQVRKVASEASRRTAERDARTPAVEAAAVAPVAQVLADVPLAHLDRVFDYLVPAALADTAVVGSKVKVRFAGQEVDGYVVARVDASEHQGRLMPIRRVLSAEPVLVPQVAELVRRVADRYAGTRSDVLRLAIPPRRAAVEKEPLQPFEGWPAVDRQVVAEAWQAYDRSWLGQLASGGSPRVVWQSTPAADTPAQDWPALLASAVAACAASGRGAIVCVPDARDLVRLDAALTDVLGSGQHLVLTADLGPTPRYRAFLSVARGSARIVIGTRAAAYAPVTDLGLVAIWDDGDDLHADQRAPYPHTREVLLLRAEVEQCAVLVGGYARTVEGSYLVHSGWARAVASPREIVRSAAPTVSIAGASEHDLARDRFARTARIPSAAHQLLRAALATGPVLVQAPRHGYTGALVCDRCRAAAQCARCQGPLTLQAAYRPPSCRWCGHEEPGRRCPECGGQGLRAPVVGSQRTAEELGKAFPGVPVMTSSGDRVLAEVPSRPAIVVATPGAEPVAPGGYAGALLLDTWLMLARPDLRTHEETLRRLLNAAALVRSDGSVLAVGDPAERALQALVRWDPIGFSERELTERQQAHLPPASRLATVTAEPDTLEEYAAGLVLPVGAELLGPVPVPDDRDTDRARLVVRVPRTRGKELSRALAEAQALRSARKLPPVRVHVDPVALD
ncbi:MAG: primosomal protein N' [Nocardioidaceae bacterium]